MADDNEKTALPENIQGMFKAANRLGGGGQVNPQASNDFNTALYATFSVVGFFAWTVTNALGIKIALSLGGLGYTVQASSYLCHNHTESYGYIVFAGFFLGCCAGQNIHVSTVIDGTYIGFLVLAAAGACLAWTLVYEKHAFNDVSLAQFDTRTRALSSTLYRSAQIIGTMVFGFALDFHKLRRTIRAKLAWAALLVLTMAISNGGYTFQTEYTSAEATQIDYVKMDWTDGSSYTDRLSYTFLMAFSMPPGKRFYKDIQSAGAAIMGRLEGLPSPPPYISLFASCWALLAGSLIIASPVLIWKIKDITPADQDLKFADQTADEVAGHNAAADDREKV
ncbi:hypothetical protein D0869_02831 [Hortaea werneckii]|uniref:DUF895 domain membrane protein n=1 Tax=Hortaea werneckii TaxID=91943 RepID=A0A3M6X7X6_HORWE|nr:hypothetical protein D0869_02831 [Hortaea werneckii]